jgi:ABC-type polysaccharide/polyol phosphate export permease
LILKDFCSQMKSLDRYYFLSIYFITRHQINRNYKNSFMGVLWSFLHPMAQVIIYSQVFSRLMKFPVENYILFLSSSFLLWGFITASITGNCNSLIVNSEKILRCTIPRTIFPLSGVFTNLYNYVLTFIIMILFVTLFQVSPPVTIFLFPIYLVWIIFIVSSTAISFAYLTTYVRDLPEVATVGFNIFFWLTPIVYPIEIISEEYRYLYSFNPFYIMIRPVMNVVYKGVLPGLDVHIELLILTVIATYINYYIYRKCGKYFIYYL